MSEMPTTISGEPVDQAVQRHSVAIEELYSLIGRLRTQVPAGSEFVVFTAHAGSGGSSSVACTFTYTFTTQDGIVHSNVSPSSNRLKAAVFATHGYWYVNPTTGSGTLYCGDEFPDGAACT